MLKFEFRLNSVLKLKTQMEDNAKNELAGATRVLMQQQEFLNGLNEANTLTMDTLNSETTRGISVYKIRGYNNFFSMMKDKIELQKENVNNAQKDVDISRELLVKAVQERKILEKLKEKKYDEHLKEREKAEQLLIDELNSFKFKNN